MAYIALNDIESALISAIRVDPTLSAYTKTVDSYQGNLGEDIAKMTALMPAIFALYSGARRISESVGRNAVLHEELTWGLIVCAKDLRGEKYARTEASGVYQMIDALETLLFGNRLGMDISPFMPNRNYLIHTSKSLSIFGCEYLTRRTGIPA
jgi:phage gp37-like protein